MASIFWEHTLSTLSVYYSHTQSAYHVPSIPKVHGPQSQAHILPPLQVKHRDLSRLRPVAPLFPSLISGWDSTLTLKL